MKIRDDVGYIGVGTLIIFITTILIAAVAASVMIFAVQQMAQQARKTAAYTLQEVSSGLRIIDVIGDKNINGSAFENTTHNVQVLLLTVKVMHGGPEINFNDIIVYVTDYITSVYLKLNTTTFLWDPIYADNQTYLVRVDIDVDKSFQTYHVISLEDIVTIVINLGPYAANITLSPNDEIEVKIIPKIGTITYERFTVMPSHRRYCRLI